MILLFILVQLVSSFSEQDWIFYCLWQH